MSELMRTQRLVEQARASSSMASVRRAQAFYGAKPSVQTESQLLATSACTAFVGPLPPLTESARINNLVQKVLAAEEKFGEFVRFFPTPCPVVPPLSYLPAPSKACPLPNSPLNLIGPA